ncbi:F-box/LRR-repeat protein [Trifolium repens]|nr:F-box/LRR-repeat protein [Trifolium repens]
MVATAAVVDIYLPDECWECILINIRYHRHLNSLSVVSKRFLSITNRVRFFLAIFDGTHPFLSSLFHRFPNLTSLDLTYYIIGDLNNLLHQISLFPLKLTSLIISGKETIPANGLRDFPQNITTLTSLTCSGIQNINSTDLFLIANCFPLLEELDLRNPIRYNNQLLDEVETLPLSFSKLRKVTLSNSYDINDQLFFHLFKNCKLLEEAIMDFCRGVTNAGIVRMIVENSNLEKLNLSNTVVNDETLYVISKSCHGLLHLILQSCADVTEKGVKHVLENCTKLRKIDLYGCDKAHFNDVVSMVLSRPSLRMVITPAANYRLKLSETDREVLSRQRCIVL